MFSLFTGLATVYRTVFPYVCQRLCSIFHNSPYPILNHNMQPIRSLFQLPPKVWQTLAGCPEQNGLKRGIQSWIDYEIIWDHSEGLAHLQQIQRVPGWHVCGQTIPVISLELLSQLDGKLANVAPIEGASASESNVEWAIFDTNWCKTHLPFANLAANSFSNCLLVGSFDATRLGMALVAGQVEHLARRM